MGLEDCEIQEDRNRKIIQLSLSRSHKDKDNANLLIKF